MVRRGRGKLHWAAPTKTLTPGGRKIGLGISPLALKPRVAPLVSISSKITLWTPGAWAKLGQMAKLAAIVAVAIDSWALGVVLPPAVAAPP